jgi:hypothetical protein
MSQSLLVALIVIVAIVVIAIAAVLARTAGRPRLRQLPDESRDRYARMWQAIETRFIDNPQSAVRDADKVVVMILSERGANLTDGSRMRHELRKARALGAGEQPARDTEELRTAMVHYKAIVEDALGSARLSREAGPREMAS